MGSTADERWERYLREVDTYGDTTALRVQAPITGSPNKPRGADFGGMGLALGVFGALAQPLAAIAQPARPVAGLLSAFRVLTAGRRAAVTGESIVASTVANASAWTDLARQERALPARADHAAVAFRLVTLCEGATRTITFWEAGPIERHVVAAAGGDGRFLDKVLSNGRGLTWSALVAWLKGLEAALESRNNVVTAWLTERLARPDCLTRASASSTLRELTDFRNSLAHADGSAVAREQHDAAAIRLLGAPLRKWMSAQADTFPNAPTTSLLLSRAERVRQT